MAVSIAFDGENKIIVISDIGNNVITTPKEIYSRWKDWVLSGNSEWIEAFRTFGGDPLGGGVFAGDYYFLNNVAGWRIKPEEKNHNLIINGNLFGEDADTPIFLQTIGGFNVNIRQGYSSLTQTATFNSGSGLDSEQAAKLDEIYDQTQLIDDQLEKVTDLHKIHGLETGTPLVVNPTTRSAGSIEQNISQSGNEVTVNRI